jgi:hypothetical protein
MTSDPSTAKHGKTKATASQSFGHRNSDGQSELTQFTMQMRSALHRELARKALNSGMTMRGYIMKALRDSGLKVTQADLVDRRRHL